MKRTDAFQPEPIPSTADSIPELDAWFDCLTIGAHAGLALRTPASFAAKPPTLYLETTIVIYLTARLSRDGATARHQSVTRDRWNTHLIQHIAYSSDVVSEEASRGDPEAARRRLDTLAQFASAHSSEQTCELADRILAMCRLPARVYEDAHHVAIAAIHGINVLLTWNCKPLANENMIPFMGRACEAYGYAPPVIYTPEQLIGACAYGRPDP
jgi:hypothetical protein